MKSNNREFVVWLSHTLHICEDFIYSAKFKEAFFLLSIIVDELKKYDGRYLSFYCERVKETQQYFQFAVNNNKVGLPILTFKAWRGDE